ncbi:UNVERIFIED_CONTAM: hypothetical protein PYX00_009018 [Menopon gallinae]|uniref:Carbohydrate sulfotransferase n=1 Tax=Menopon gallinae TaxID=328185 RepID=A0AAW2HAC1_9NEOP
MKKYHRLLIYVVFAGLTFFFLVALSVTISERSKQRENRRYGRRIGKRTEEVRDDYPDDVEADGERGNTERQIRNLLKVAEAENNKRLETIESTCKKYNLGSFRTANGPKIDHPPVPQYSVFYIDRANKLSYCPIYKAGSSTWLYNLCLLAGMTEEEIETSKQQISVLAREKYEELEPPAAEEALQKTLKIMSVRHPFERLLSAYRDKLENTNYGQEHGTIHFYKKFGRKIVKKYRENGNNTKAWELLKPSQYLWNPEVPKPAGVEPTFREFVRYLIDANLIQYADDHWIPFYLYCTPCLLHYNVIAKVETMDRDQLYVIRLLGLQDRIKPRWRHKTQFTAGNAEKVSNIAKIYFQQLSVNEVNALYQKYKIDFELFGYDYKEYLQYAHDFENSVQRDDTE